MHQIQQISVVNNTNDEEIEKLLLRADTSEKLAARDTNQMKAQLMAQDADLKLMNQALRTL